MVPYVLVPGDRLVITEEKKQDWNSFAVGILLSLIYGSNYNAARYERIAFALKPQHEIRR